MCARRTPTKPDKGKGGIPIIIVPAAATAAVNMYNAKVRVSALSSKQWILNPL